MHDSLIYWFIVFLLETFVRTFIHAYERSLRSYDIFMIFLIPYMYTHAHLYIPFFIFQFILSPNSLQGLCYLFVTGAKLNLSYLILSCLVLSSSYHLITILSSHLISSHLISYHIILYQHLLNYTLSVSIYSIILLMHAATIKISSGHTTQ